MFDVITSKDNKTIKNIIKLQSKKYREETSLYLAEGRNWVLDAAKKHSMSDIIHKIVLSETQSKQYNQSEFDSFIDKDKILVASDDVFSKIATTENSQGILCVLKQNINADIPKNKKIILLDGLQDPGNMGTIIRTACAFGFTDVILRNSVDIFNPKVVRSSMSALLDVNLFYYSAEGIKSLKSSGCKIIIADLNGTEISKNSIKTNKDNICLVIGNEANGISDEIKNIADLSYKIPINNIESLNAAVAAGIMMFYLS